MQTLYIDVYFLINFTVDFIALYFAVVFSKVPTTAFRLAIGSVFGGAAAVVYVLSPEKFLIKLLVSVLGLYLTVSLSVNKVSLFRKLKVVFSFLIFGALLGALVHYIYGIFDKYLYEYLKESEGGAENRKILLFSLIVLLSIGVFKMLISFFKNIESEGSAMLEITVFGNTIKTEAFIDSGNLAIDPMDMRPILFLKQKLAEELLPSSIINLTNPDALEREARKRIRLIPISKGGNTHVLTGVRADRVYLIRGEAREELAVTLAIDKEEGSFGGYSALLPSSVIENGN